MAILRWGVLAAPPPELAWKIGQFESRGRVVTHDEEAWPESVDACVPGPRDHPATLRPAGRADAAGAGARDAGTDEGG
ncbi:hypothetical protein ACRAWD_07220 [Caulobacter segnis]